MLDPGATARPLGAEVPLYRREGSRGRAIVLTALGWGGHARGFFPLGRQTANRTGRPGPSARAP